MKTEKNILIAFILNLIFSIIELLGGIFTNCISILSDAIHDICDSISIGISFILEKISKKSVNDRYTFGYVRYSVLGALITNLILIVSSILIIYNAIKRFNNPVIINYDAMIIISVIGIILNMVATIITKENNSLNEKAVSLHMFEDTLGWIIVFIGSIIIKITQINNIDSIMSIGVSLFIFIHAFKNLNEIVKLFLIKTPKNISLNEIKKELLKIKNILDVHHIHIWSLDGIRNYATMHIVTNKESFKLKKEIKEKLFKFNIIHTTIEFEKEDEFCYENSCNLK